MISIIAAILFKIEHIKHAFKDVIYSANKMLFEDYYSNEIHSNNQIKFTYYWPK